MNDSLEDEQEETYLNDLMQFKATVYPRKAHDWCPYCKIVLSAPHVCYELYKRMQKDLNRQALVDAQNLKNIRDAEWACHNEFVH